MARTKLHKTAPALPTYHLAARLAGLATDTLYRFTEGRRTLAPLDGLIVSALLRAHPWGYSCQLDALDADGQSHASAEATAAHPLPTGIRSRITTFTSGSLTWQHGAATITDTEAPQYLSAPTLYLAAGRHHYQIRQHATFDTGTNAIRTHCHLSIDGHHHEPAFAGVVGASIFVVDQYES